ncbi:hypothetical protein WJ966_00850 [Achromobacter xylosoxidans]
MDQLFPVAGPSPAFLLGVDDPLADRPVTGRHQCIDPPRRAPAGAIEQFDDIAMNTGIAGRQHASPARPHRRLSCHAIISV